MLSLNATSFKSKFSAASTQTFSEISTLLRRNAAEDRNVLEMEIDLKRLLLMSRDTTKRDEMLEFQAIQLITRLLPVGGSVPIKSFCAGILANLGVCAKGQASASTCRTWNCVSHRHNCPLFVLVSHAETSSDPRLRALCAAALINFSMDTECQLHIDKVSGIPILLHLLDVNDADVTIYAAATLWNLCKSPVVLLKLETIHALLKDRLVKKLTTVLATSVDPFDLYATPSGERGSIGLLYSDDEWNENLMLSCSVSSSLSIVLQVESYTGPKRTMEDQFLSVHQKQRTEQTSTFDENGVLTSRKCEVCKKKCRLKRVEDLVEEDEEDEDEELLYPGRKKVLAEARTKRQRARAENQLMDRVLVCAIERCRRAYHFHCSRWRKLKYTQVEHELDGFLCDECVLLEPLRYVDFLAHHEQNGVLVSEAQFNTVRLEREVSNVQAQQGLLTLFDHRHQVLAIGSKQFHTRATSLDEETWLVRIEMMLKAVTMATQQQQQAVDHQHEQQQAEVKEQLEAKAKLPVKSPDKSGWRLPFTGAKTKRAEEVTPTDSLDGMQQVIAPWRVSFVSAKHVIVRVGNVAFWPRSAVQEVSASIYKTKTLEELELCAIYEFVDAQQQQQFAFGAPPQLQPSGSLCLPPAEAVPEAQSRPTSASQPESGVQNGSGLWSLLFPRKTTCVKLLGQQVGCFKHQRIKRQQEIAAKHREAKAKARAKKKIHFTAPLQRQELLPAHGTGQGQVNETPDQPNPINGSNSSGAHHVEKA